MTTETVNPEIQSMEYRTEVKQLLDILAHSLYTEREIFLRELVSNASDALNRIQFELLTNQNVTSPENELAIRLRADKDAGTLTIADSGIGMNREDMIENLGTIAQSGAKTFLQNASTGENKLEDIIGQFGVGFYSVFMVAEEVTVTSRSYRTEDQGWQWKSTGDSQFTIEAVNKEDRGTTIEIKFKEDATEFADTWRLEQIIKKHSDYVSFPIYTITEEEIAPADDDVIDSDVTDSDVIDTGATDDGVIDVKATTETEKVVNKQTALWRQATSSVENDEYTDFYKQLTFDFEKPLVKLHMVVDSPVHIRSILFVPSKRERSLMTARTGHGLKLYSRKVLIQEKYDALLPEYFRFVEGVVDSDDIPLNVSREMVQSNPLMRQLQKALTSRMTRELKNLAEREAADYNKFWQEFGIFIKEGVATDFASQETLMSLLRFHSSKAAGAAEWTSLSEYIVRMKPDQENIYYVLGEDLNTVARSPHLDYFRANDIEVIYMTDPIDGFMTSSIREFEGKSLKNIDDAGLELPKSDDDKDNENALSQDDFDKLVERFKKVLGDRVTGVSESKQLVNSPTRLVSPENTYDRDLHRIRRMTEENFEVPKKLLELNRSHPMIANLSTILTASPKTDVVDNSVEQLFANALLMEGLHPNPSEMVERIQSLMEMAVASKV